MRSTFKGQVAGLVLLAALPVARAGLAGATKDSQPPDKEMLRMMDFLREMELIKQAEMMRELSPVEQLGDSSSDNRVRQPLPDKRKEAVK